MAVESEFSAVKYHHRVSRRFELQTTHPLQGNFLEGVTRSYVESRTQQRLRRANIMVCFIDRRADVYASGSWGASFVVGFGCVIFLPGASGRCVCPNLYSSS